MNKIYTILFLLLSYFTNAQLSKQDREAQKMELEVAVYSQLIMESQQVDLKKINSIILKKINRDYLTKPNLVFVIENLNPAPFDEVQALEQTTSRMRNPYLNQVTFWNKKNITFLVKKLKKNLIPYKTDVFNFGYFNPENKNLMKSIDDSYIKQHILEQKEGKIITIKDNKVSEEKILYFPNDAQPLLLKKNGENCNFDVIKIDFSNIPEKIVAFTISYNFGIHKERFVYQYTNNQWKPITD